MTDFEQFGDKFYRNGELIGQIHRTIQTATYVTPRETTKHWFRKYQGWAMGLEHLKALKEQGVTVIQVEVDQHRIVAADLDAWIKYGFTVQYAPYEAQKVLPEAYFRDVTR
jgi:hypothetical protein